MEILFYSEPDNQNTKELKRLEDIAKVIETSTLERLIDKGKATYQDINNYRNIVELTETHRTASFVEKFANFFKMLWLRLKAMKHYKSLNKESKSKNLKIHSKMFKNYAYCESQYYFTLKKKNKIVQMYLRLASH